MRFKSIHGPRGGAERRPEWGGPGRERVAKPAGGRAGFTLVEVLAALTFMAIVIPVAVEGLRIANLAGQVGQRKAVATRVAERVLNEVVVTGQVSGAGASGVIEEGTTEFQWRVRMENWTVDTMRMVTVQVSFPVQGREYEVTLSTLVGMSM